MKHGSTRKPGRLSSGEQRAHVRQVFHCERIWRTFVFGKAIDGFGRCTQRRKSEGCRCVSQRLCNRATAGALHKSVPLECSSRMTGNCHARFRGGPEAARPPAYPVWECLDRMLIWNEWHLRRVLTGVGLEWARMDAVCLGEFLAPVSGPHLAKFW